MSDEDLTEAQLALAKVAAGLIPATAQEVATALGKLSLEMHNTAVALDAAEDDSLLRIEAHGRAYDQAFLKAAFDPADPTKKITEKVRDALAREETWKERLKMEQAKQEVRKLRRRLETLDRRIWAGQSIAKTVRAETRTIGYGQYGA
jgi:hypothetical protein